MTEQLELCAEPVQGSEGPGLDESIEERFARFHRDNPHVYDAVVRGARFLKYGMGRSRGRVKEIFERLRSDDKFIVRGDEDFKLNDHFTALYARLIMAREADLGGFFETRRRPSLCRGRR